MTTRDGFTPTPDNEIATLLVRLGCWHAANNDFGNAIVLLVAICNALATLNHPEADPITDDGTRRPIGLNLLIPGAMMSGLIADQVIRPIRPLQARIVKSSADLAQLFDDARAGRSVEARGLKARSTLDHSKDLWQITGIDFLQSPQNYSDEGIRRPFVFSTSTDAKQIREQFRFAHRKKLLLHVPLSRVEQVDALDEVLNDLMSGSLRESVPKHASDFEPGYGHVMACAPKLISDAIASPHLCRATWSHRLLWLVKPKFQFAVAHDIANSIERENLDRLFKSALWEVMHVRMSEKLPVPPEALNRWHSANWFAREAALSKLPREMAGVAAKLFPTLMFGLRLLHKAGPRLAFTPELEKLALTLSCLILDAATDYYLHLRSQHQYAVQRELAWKVYCKLQDKPGSPRDLVRRSHNLRTDDLNGVLDWLHSLGLVTQQNGNWQANDFDGNPRLTIANSIPNKHVFSNETLG